MINPDALDAFNGRFVLNAKEVRSAIPIGPTTLHHETTSGRLKSFKIGDRRLYRVEDVKQYLQDIIDGRLVATGRPHAEKPRPASHRTPRKIGRPRRNPAEANEGAHHSSGRAG